jgi:Flp pilus assembly protein TadB
VVRPPRRRRGTQAPDVHRITDARRSHAEDQHDRMVKYTVSMSIRMVCLVLALVVTGPLRWVFIAGAVLLPYVAVVIANASREQAPPPPEAWSVAPPALEPGRERPPEGP